MRKFIGDIGRGFYNLFIGTLIVALVAGSVALATNYTMTQGAGTTFGSLVVSTVNYAQQLFCDPITPTQCAAVASNGQLSVALNGGTAVAPNGAHNTANSSTVNIATDQSGNAYFTVAASVTAQVLGTTGATGDYLGFCTVYPTALNTGVVTVFDSTSSATNNVIAFAGGSPSVSNLVPFNIAVGAISKNGAWKVTTGTGVIVTCNGHFT